MNKIQFDDLVKPLVEIYDEIELDLIKNILNRVNNYDETSGSLKWYLEKLKDLGVLNKDNLKVFKKNKSKIKETLKQITNACGNHIEDLDKLELYFKEGKIDVDPKNLFNSVAINNMINETLKDTLKINELIQTKAIEYTKDVYKNIINKAYVETSSGIYTYTTSIRKALDEFAKKGIKIASYESGRTFSIESVVRRDVITRENKLIGDIELQHAKELGTNLVYVDQHLGARVRTKYTKYDYEAHAEWQGKKYMIEGASKEYPNLIEVTGYGEMLGLKGLNCYHNMRPTWEWEKIDERIDEIENANAYELKEKQRTYERKIRQLKRQRLVANGTEDYSIINKKLKETGADFDNWLKKNKLNRDYNREYISDNKIKYSELEQSAFSYYISPSSIALNEKLRNHIELSKEGKNIVDNLDSALAKTPNYNGFIVRDLDIKDVAIFMKDIKIGELYSTNQYLSFSNGKRFNENANIRIYIENSKYGKDLVKINSIGENEVLYERNRTFKTLNIAEKDGIIYILWEEIE